MVSAQQRKETTMSTNQPKNGKSPDSGTKPVAKLRVGLLNASIWARSTENGSFHAVTFERRYCDAAGNWNSSHSYDAQDLLTLAKLADLAHTKILELQAPGAA
jgi:hypothetical protein